MADDSDYAFTPPSSPTAFPNHMFKRIEFADPRAEYTGFRNRQRSGLVSPANDSGKADD
jgi:hypothetical protein